MNIKDISKKNLTPDQTYFLGVLSGMDDSSSIILRIIDNSLEDGVETHKVIAALRKSIELSRKEYKIRYERVLGEAK